MDQATYTQTLHILQGIYAQQGLPLYERGGITYPFHLTPAAGATLATLLAPTPPTQQLHPADLAFYDTQHLAHLQAGGRRLYNGATFTLAHLERDPLRLHAFVGRYFDFIATCSALEAELLAGGALPLRDALHRHTPPTDIPWNGAGRSTAIGVSTLLLFRDGGGYRALIAQRSAQTAHMPGALHVTPAFMFQPAGPDVQPGEWDLQQHIIREYLEELFGVREAEHGGPDEEHPAEAQLQAMLANGSASLALTGLTANLITTHVSVCALLLIHDEGWFPAWQQNAPAMWETQRWFTPRISTDAALWEGLPPAAHRRFAPNGASALWLGLDAARQQLR